MGGKLSRTKGHSYERAIAKKLRHIYPEAKRHLEVQMSDCKGYDLDHTGKYRIQCKRHKKYVSISKIFEVEEEKGCIPVLITKGDNLPEMAVIPLDHFIKLLEVENDYSKENSKEEDQTCTS